MPNASAAVFEDQGNRFLVPGFIWTDEDRPAGWMLDAMGFAMCLGIKCERDCLALEMDASGSFAVPHLRTEMGSRSLMHGRTSVLIISGPLFDQVANHSSKPHPGGPQP